MIVRTPDNPPRELADLLPPALCDQLDRLDIKSRRILRGRLPGERRSRRRGRSVEFDDHRPYRPGDDLRHIDWNAYARLDRLFIKLFLEEEDLAMHLLVDVSASMDASGGDRPTKRIAAIRLAMMLGYVALVNQNRLTVRTIGDTEPRAPIGPIRGRRSVERLAAALLEAAARPTPPLGARTPLLDDARRFALTKPDRGVCVVLSDFLDDEDPADALRLCAAAGGRGAPMDGLCVQVLDPAEIDPTQARDDGLIGDLRLIDAERGLARPVTVGDAMIRRYRQAFERRQARGMAAARAAGMRWLTLTTDEDPGAFVLHALRGAGVVG